MNLTPFVSHLHPPPCPDPFPA